MREDARKNNSSLITLLCTRSRFVGATGVNCIQHRVSIEYISLALHVKEVITKKKRVNLSTPQNSYFTADRKNFSRDRENFIPAVKSLCTRLWWVNNKTASAYN